ncbi:sugar ABC transporter ATP-binding protein [Saccharophagus degradans]|uniref:sugar ABC transporter ATP-binding protein n=1 Tax=Saccharophagus degradans TaxID=86304 RepID=UPI001C093BF7|nr:sugar ABC transporter ATP-binding protein [Saccharophagus degradans]MBU2984835.1 sugar ABC transporter ATP-binding protein [Saccharophagus degradans]
MTDQNPLLALRGVGKVFPGVIALQGVDFTLRAGEIHALLGENGAGKSTLIKVMTGVYQKDSGSIAFKGENIHPTCTGDAQALGISTVYQEVNLLPNLSVAHNVYLGREPRKFGLINWKKINRDAAELLKGYNLNIDVTKPLSHYSVAVQQLIAIARGVDMSSGVLILDEPTASLDAGEVQALFKVMREIAAKGIGIVFVTHFLDQVYAVCDRITILRNGTLVGEWLAKDLSQHDLVSNMLGKEIEHSSKTAPVQQDENEQGEALLALKQAAAKGSVEPLSVSVKAGQVLGLAGLLGSGRTELCKLVFGVDALNEGDILLNGKPVKFKHTREAVLAGMGLCPEDRKHDGIFGPMSIRENMIIALQNKRGWWKYIPLKKQKELAEHYVKALKIATSDIEKPIEQLSGGNQQKVILARWLASEPVLLLLDEPTRGIDVGAHAEIIALIRQLCEQGLGLVVASSELEELVAFSDKVLVLRDRKKVAEISGSQINQQNIMQAIAGS